MASAEINGTTLELHEHGSGEPIVFVHGSASDVRTWRLQEDVFSKQFRTIAYSRRYHWPNTKISDGSVYAVEEHVDDLEALIRSRDTAPVHLVGHSYGGYICLILATRAPALIRSLVLAEPPVMTLFVSIPPKPVELLRLAFKSPGTAAGIVKLGAMGLGPAGSAFKRGDQETAMQRLGTAILGEKYFNQLTQRRVDQVRDNLIKDELLGSETFIPLKIDRVRQVNIPTLLIGSQQSPNVFTRLLDHLAEFLPQSERVEIQNASHLMHEDNADEYNRAVMSFISAQRV